MGPLGSPRALNVILVKISLVGIYLIYHNWYMTIFLLETFWLTSQLYSRWMSSAARIILVKSVEEEMWFWELCLEMLWVSPIYFISFNMRVVIWDYIEGLYRSQLLEFSHELCGLKIGGIFYGESMLAGILRKLFFCNCAYVLLCGVIINIKPQSLWHVGRVPLMRWSYYMTVNKYQLWV